MKISIILALMLTVAAVLFFFRPPPLAGLNSMNIMDAIAAVLVLSISARTFHARMSRGYSTCTLAVEAILALVAVATFRAWSPHAPYVWRTAVSSLPLFQTKIRMQMVSVPIAQIVRLAFWFILMICITRLVARVIKFIGKASSSRLEFGYSRAAQECAEVIIGFLNISHLANEMIKRIQNGESAEDRAANPLAINEYYSDDLARYPSSSSRMDIHAGLDQLAYLVRVFHGQGAAN